VYNNIHTHPQKKTHSIYQMEEEKVDAFDLYSDLFEDYPTTRIDMPHYMRATSTTTNAEMYDWTQLRELENASLFHPDFPNAHDIAVRSEEVDPSGLFHLEFSLPPWKPMDKPPPPKAARRAAKVLPQFDMRPMDEEILLQTMIADRDTPHPYLRWLTPRTRRVPGNDLNCIRSLSEQQKNPPVILLRSSLNTDKLVPVDECFIDRSTADNCAVWTVPNWMYNAMVLPRASIITDRKKPLLMLTDGIIESLRAFYLYQKLTYIHDIVLNRQPFNVHHGSPLFNKDFIRKQLVNFFAPRQQNFDKIFMATIAILALHDVDLMKDEVVRTVGTPAGGEKERAAYEAQATLAYEAALDLYAEAHCNYTKNERFTCSKCRPEFVKDLDYFMTSVATFLGWKVTNKFTIAVQLRMCVNARHAAYRDPVI
jgi:hypothetical protein